MSDDLISASGAGNHENFENNSAEGTGTGSGVENVFILDSHPDSGMHIFPEVHATQSRIEPPLSTPQEREATTPIARNFESPNRYGLLRKATDVVRVLPEFDGQNMPVEKFIKDFERAAKFVAPEDREFFLVLVKSKIVKSAGLLIHDREIETLEQLAEHLRRAFASAKNLPQLQVDLA
ncbi:hypothetical protein QAD02_019574 [Eretmocerus hayati]|uniref:Uncharacterized protein n=1 Tax=Eretmocerus hayati TaxID=131215 RepID=A0ACC2PK78_9HYME|nr:hypothetical protein QAD02_019574 [Eretmocerus hayati]